MKKSLLLSLLLIISLYGSAQWVTIPDAAFANKLNQFYPACMNGNQMDTSCPGIVNAVSLFLNASGISNLSGIEHFVNLTSLYCNNNNISTISALPPSLQTLICNLNPPLSSISSLPTTLTYLDVSYCNLAFLPPLPASLIHLNCYFNPPLSSLPPLPASLQYLDCGWSNISSLPQLPIGLLTLGCGENNITSLPELPSTLTNLGCSSTGILSLPELPNSLTHLYCSSSWNLNSLPTLPPNLSVLHCFSNGFTSLPELPASLTQLHCYSNNLTALPQLPASLTQLLCYSNNLTALPQLPASLTQLHCYSNNLTALPQLPASLTQLHCYSNNLTALPQLPASLTQLHCFSNNLSSLPQLPSGLTAFRCHNNQLSCLPTLPMTLSNSTITNFNISNNSFICLPNYVPAMSGASNSVWLSYPLCDYSDLINNPFGCDNFTGIAGTVFEDENANCDEDVSESRLVNIPLKLLDETGNLVAASYSFGNTANNTGVYNFVTGAGAYSVQLVTENKPYQVSCDVPGDEQNISLTLSQPMALNVDFGVECLPGFDIGVQSVVSTGWVFPGQDHTLRIVAGDMSAWYGLQCASNVSGTVNVNVSGPVSYIGPASGALTPSVTGELQFTYDIADFAAVNMSQDFRLIFQTDTTVQGGELICVAVNINPTDGDLNPNNNAYNHCYTVVNSYDPNIKVVWPMNVEPGYDGYFNYTIYFQNTGTAPAFNIRLADTLDTNLDLNTFEVTNYSHPVLTYLHGNVLTFRFNNIMLPDSTSDPEGSIGYVQYRIKPVAGLPVGTVIENTAHIFFDFNDAIVTNTTQNEFEILTSLADHQQGIVHVYPNPGTGIFNLNWNNENGANTIIEVYNIRGERVINTSTNQNPTTLDLSGRPAGMYLVRVNNQGNTWQTKVILR